MTHPNGEIGTFLEDDKIPESLNPILSRFFGECFPVLEETVSRIAQFFQENPQSPKIPRSLGETDFVIGSAKGKRRVLTFQQWMLQRSLDCYRSIPDKQKGDVNDLLKSIGGESFMAMQLGKRLTRKNFRIVPDA